MYDWFSIDGLHRQIRQETYEVSIPCMILENVTADVMVFGERPGKCLVPRMSIISVKRRTVLSSRVNLKYRRFAKPWLTLQ